MSTRYDARRSYQRTALDRHATTVISLLLVVAVIAALVVAGLYVKSEADAFVQDFQGQTGQWISALSNL